MRFALLVALLALPVCPSARLSAQAPAPANRAVYLDSSGVVRWRDNRQEVAIFGSNYVIHTASDYRAAGYVGGDRKRMIDEDVAQMARMGWDGLRLTFWGDWESADSAGNLIANDHLDLLDYLVAQARARGIYMLFSPIQLYSSNWPDAQQRDPSMAGFGRVFGRQRMGTDPAAIAAQVNYLKQILDHVNPYTGVALKNEPAIIFIELVNEPWHHSDDIPGSINYLNALTDAVRSTGCNKLVFYNVSQDFRIGEAIRRSKVQGLTFGWYPTGLVSGHELRGNYLRAVDTYPDMLRPELARMPRIVYEFDSPDLRNATMYPAMARTMRAVGSQAALMFAYDMQGTASRNLGWQTHYLSLAYTPRKAMSTVIATEVMHRLPRMRPFGSYPANLRFGDFRLSPDSDLAELVTRDVFLNAGATTTPAPDAAALRRVAGVGSSPIVRYEGLGAYFLDRIRPGLWRLEVYPDAVPVRDPFEQQSPDKIVTRAISRAWPMTVILPDLGGTYTAQPLTAGNGAPARAEAGRVTVMPGVYLLSASGPVDAATLPSHVGYLALAEFHGPPADTLPASVQSLAAPEYLAGRTAEVRVRIVTQPDPDSATLFVRRTAGDFYHAVPMRKAGAYEYAATVPANLLRDGPYEFLVAVRSGSSVTTYPGGATGLPWAWNYHNRESWRFDVAGAATPLVLFDPSRDAGMLTFTRIGDAGRRGIFRLVPSQATGRPAFHLELPVDSASGWVAPDYTASLVVRDRILSRAETMTGAEGLQVRLKGLGARQVLHVTLMEDDGTSWTTALSVDSAWSENRVPLSTFTVGRGVLLPQGFPGEWSYWVPAADGRGGAGDRPRADHIERIQLSLRREEGSAPRPGSYGVEIESIALTFGR